MVRPPSPPESVSKTIKYKYSALKVRYNVIQKNQ